MNVIESSTRIEKMYQGIYLSGAIAGIMKVLEHPDCTTAIHAAMQKEIYEIALHLNGKENPIDGGLK